MKVLNLDIETLPLEGMLWSLWQGEITHKQLLKDLRIATWTAKWHGDNYIYQDSLHHYGQEKDHDDYEVVRSLADMVEEADMVVAHNGKKFDMKKLKSRMIYHGMSPLAPVKVYDTLQVARREFNFTSNRLDYLGDYLGVGGKYDTGGRQLWTRCRNGERKAYKEMLDYNARDVILLEDVYNALTRWDSKRPNVNLWEFKDDGKYHCPNHTCDSTKFQLRGSAITTTGRYARVQCTKCGTWGRLNDNELDVQQRKKLIRSV